MIRCGSCGEDNARSARFCSACGAPLTAEGQRDTRRVVTVLFADLVGSTTIGERLEAETFRAIQTRYFATVRAVIERHGGTVEKYIGDAVMAVFGLPTLHEDDALRAVRAAADLVPCLGELDAEIAERHGFRLQIRVGVHTGEVVAGDAAARQAMVSGDTVNTAARLEAVAGPGEILLGPVTTELVRDAVAVEALDALSLRGRDETLTAFRLVAITGTEAHVRRLDTPLVGRGEELAALRAVFDRAVGDRGCELVTIVAPAGTGKSRLVREFLAAAEPDATIVRGRCLNYGEGITYWALGEILRAATGVEETDDPDAVRAKVAARLDADADAVRIAGILSSVLGVSSEPASAEDITWAVRRSFAVLAADRPLVVLVEDVHWAEPALLDMLEAIVDWSRDAPILLLCPARPELLEARPDWGEDRPNAWIIRLEPLDASNASALVEVLPGGPALPGPLRARILEAAEGNPLFVEEFLAMLVDAGHLVREAEGTWAAVPDIDEVAVPRSISLLMAARLDSLDAGDRTVAQRGSVVGRVFERGAVSELSPESERAKVADCLMSLVQRQVIRPDDPGLDGDDAFRFRHVLIRDAAYEALTKSERADLHERFARWLEHVAPDRLQEYAEVYAHHLAAAVGYRVDLGSFDGPDALQLATDAMLALVRAAERSEQLHAYREALRHYRAAFDLMDRCPKILKVDDRGRLLSRAAEAAANEGDAAAAITLLGSAITIADAEGDATECALLHARLARELFETGDEPRAENHAQLALATVPADASAASRAAVLADVGRLMMLMARFDESVELCEQAVALGRADVAPRARARALTTIGAVLGQTGRVAEALPRFEEAKRAAIKSGDGYELGRYYGNLASALDSDGQSAVAREVAREGIEAMARFGLERSLGANLRHNLATDELWAGRPAEARRLLLDNIELGATSSNAASEVVLGAAETLLGDYEAASAAFERARWLQRRGGRIVNEADLSWNLAIQATWLGDIDGARRCIDDCHRLVRPNDHELRVLILATALGVEADAAGLARMSGDQAGLDVAIAAAEEYAREAAVVESLEPGTGIWNNRAEAAAALCDAELHRARGDDDSATWADAATAIAESRVPHLEAYARWRQAEALAEHGSSRRELEVAIRFAVHLAQDVHEPVRLRLVALAASQTIDLSESTSA